MWLCHVLLTRCTSFQNRDCPLHFLFFILLKSLLILKNIWWFAIGLVILFLCAALVHYEWHFIVACARGSHACCTQRLIKICIWFSRTKENQDNINILLLIFFPYFITLWHVQWRFKQQKKPQYYQTCIFPRISEEEIYVRPFLVSRCLRLFENLN